MGGGPSAAETALEAALKSKASPFQASAFAVGAGASATSSPNVSEGAAGMSAIPKEYLILGGLAGVGLLAVLLLRR